MTGYIRLDVTNAIANGEIIDADVFDLEFDGVVAAFNATSGHTHGGAVGEGAPITVVGPAQDLAVGISNVRPKVTNAMDLGTSSLRFKDIYLSGSVKYSTPATARTDLGLGTAALVNTGTGGSDVPTITQADVRYVNTIGDTMTGPLGVADNVGGNGFYLNVGNAGYYWDGTNIVHSFDNGDYFFWTRGANEGGFIFDSTFYRMTTTGGLDFDQDVVRRGPGDTRYARLNSSPLFTGTVTSASSFNVADGLNYFSSGRAQLRGTGVTLDLRDTDEVGAALHVNNGTLYFTRALTDSNTWEQVGGRWPLEINLSTLAATFGGSGNFAGNITAPSFTGNGAGVTNVNATALNGVVATPNNVANTIISRNLTGDAALRYLICEYVNMSHLPSGATTDTVFYSSSDDYVRKNTAAGMRASLGISSTAEANSLYVNVAGDAMSGNLSAPSFSLSVGNSNYRWDGASVIMDLDVGDYMFFTRSTDTGGFVIGPTTYTMDATGGATSGASILRKSTADGLYAAISSAWPGVYTGSTQDNLDFPVGTVLAVTGALHIRNSAQNIYLSSTNAFQFAVSGTPLTGVWRARGSFAVGGNVTMMERVS